MAFWLERILSSKSLVCNRMQTGPISSLPASWQPSKCLRSRPHNCVQFQGCHCAPPGLHGIWQRAPLPAWVYPIQKCGPNLRNTDGCGRIFLGLLLFLSLWEYPHFNSLALPDSNPEGPSLTQVCKHVTAEPFPWKRPSSKNGRALGFKLGKGKLISFHLFIVLLSQQQGNTI